MKKTLLSDRYESSSIPNDVAEYSLGTIATHETTGYPIESQVVLSLANFLKLMNMMSVELKSVVLTREAQAIKDKLTTYNYNRIKTCEELIVILKEALTHQQFMQDVEEIYNLPSNSDNCEIVYNE